MCTLYNIACVIIPARDLRSSCPRYLFTHLFFFFLDSVLRCTIRSSFNSSSRQSGLSLTATLSSHGRYCILEVVPLSPIEHGVDVNSSLHDAFRKVRYSCFEKFSHNESFSWVVQWMARGLLNISDKIGVACFITFACLPLHPINVLESSAVFDPYTSTT